MIDNIENKIENRRIQKYSLKIRYFWKLVISLETYESELCYMDDLIFLEKKNSLILKFSEFSFI